MHLLLRIQMLHFTPIHAKWCSVSHIFLALLCQKILPELQTETAQELQAYKGVYRERERERAACEWCWVAA